MIRRPPISTRTDTLFPTRRSSDLFLHESEKDGETSTADAPARARRASTKKAAATPKATKTAKKPRAKRTVRSKQTRSEEHTSELQSLMRSSYAVFCLKKNTHDTTNIHTQPTLTHTTSPTTH